MAKNTMQQELAISLKNAWVFFMLLKHSRIYYSTNASQFLPYLTTST